MYKIEKEKTCYLVLKKTLFGWKDVCYNAMPCADFPLMIPFTFNSKKEAEKFILRRETKDV